MYEDSLLIYLKYRKNTMKYGNRKHDSGLHVSFRLRVCYLCFELRADDSAANSRKIQQRWV